MLIYSHKSPADTTLASCSWR